MAITNTAVTVTDSATELVAINGGDREAISVAVPDGGATVYLGGASVTTSNGRPLAAGQSIDITQEQGFTLPVRSAWYGIVATGTQAVRVTEVTG